MEKTDWSQHKTLVYSKEVFAHDLYLKVKAFQTKHALFTKQTSNKNLAHFPVLRSQSVNTTSATKVQWEDHRPERRICQ